jgi:aminopeptidase N
MAPATPHDPHSFGQPAQVRVRTLALDLEVSFASRTLTGTATLGIESLSPGPLILDTRDLDIASVAASPDGSRFQPAAWQLGARDPILGAPLTISPPPATKFVRIDYASRPQASGLQWLQPQQTAAKLHPFLFSQNQSIHARSWIPIQDSPGVRLTYTARIRVPQGLTALMSAESRGQRDGAFEFAMDTPIPAYLIALAVGDLRFQPLGPRTGVWAEAPVLAQAAREFEDLERMIAAAEQLYGPYRWGRYDILILPPSFPFGGMENPRLTFATPTILAGDKSLVGLVSHELAHSWSGNLVTNATWSDFWLNEGFTTYIENRIQEQVYGPELALMEQALDWRQLHQEIEALPAADTILHIDLTGRDPEDALTNVPYVKGALFLRRLEQSVGRAAFDAYLRRYFDHFAFQSISTGAMLEHLKAGLLAEHPSLDIDLQQWIYSPGLPPNAPKPESPALLAVANTAQAFAGAKLPAAKISAAGWTTQQWLEFLRSLPPLTPAQMAELDRAFRFTSAGNSEILAQWLQLAIAANYTPAFARLETFLLEVGRQKFIRPLYAALMKTPAGQARARAIYAKARPGYHPIAQAALDKILGAP